MSSLLSFLNAYSSIFIIIFLVFLIILLYQFLQINKKLSFQKKRYDRLLRGKTDINLEEVLKANSDDILEVKTSLGQLKKDFKIIEDKTDRSIQKIGFVKYDAFFDLKSKLSYSLAIVDNLNNGILFTTIYGRESCITYAKEIRNGKSLIELSDKELEALKKAMQD